ncbi:MAG: hypothetical protein H7323_07120, partial [Frankiales bacterium]|nr:hypothetical protein [Frankiales bacterium]
MTALTDLLIAWLPKQRWFGGKGRDISTVDILREHLLLQTDEVTARLLLVRASHEDGGSDVYQVLLGSRPGAVPELLLHALIGTADGIAYYDAAYDHDAVDVLLQRLSTG